MAILEVQNVSYSYGRKGTEVLHDVSCSFEQGYVYAVVGRSGSGKSTLLSLMSGLDVPKQGKILYQGESMASMNRYTLRRKKISVIYQNYSLFPLLTVLENIMYPMDLNHYKRKESRRIAKELVEKVGLSKEYYNRFPNQLSGGEQQRVGIARALAMDRKLILADEPTGNLDGENSDAIMKLLGDLAHNDQCAVVIVTHDPDVIEKADIVLKIENGVIRNV